MNTLNLTLKRAALKDHYTIGHLYIDNKYFCDTLEDKVRDTNKNRVFDNGEKKVYAKTAIPYGTYTVSMDIVSPKFKKIMPRVLDVNSFSGILIHAGNYADERTLYREQAINTNKELFNSEDRIRVVGDNVKIATTNMDLEDFKNKYGISLHNGMWEIETFKDKYKIYSIKDNTYGCILVGENKIVGELVNSKNTFEKLYPILMQAKKDGKKIKLTIE